MFNELWHWNCGDFGKEGKGSQGRVHLPILRIVGFLICIFFCIPKTLHALDATQNHDRLGYQAPKKPTMLLR